MKYKHIIAKSLMIFGLVAGCLMLLIAYPKKAMAIGDNPAISSQSPVNGSAQIDPNGADIQPYMAVGIGEFNGKINYAKVYVPVGKDATLTVTENCSLDLPGTSPSVLYSAYPLLSDEVHSNPGASLSNHQSSNCNGGVRSFSLNLSGGEPSLIKGHEKYKPYYVQSIMTNLSSEGSVERSFRLSVNNGAVISFSRPLYAWPVQFNTFSVYQRDAPSLGGQKWNFAFQFAPRCDEDHPASNDVITVYDADATGLVNQNYQPQNISAALYQQNRFTGNGWQGNPQTYNASQVEGGGGDGSGTGSGSSAGLPYPYDVNNKYKFQINGVNYRNTIQLAISFDQFDAIVPCPRPPAVATCNAATAGINPANINQASPFTVNVANNGGSPLDGSYSLRQTYWSNFDTRQVALSRSLTGGKVGSVPYTGPGYLGPGQSGDFNFNVSRSASGTYYFDFQMQQNGNLVGNNCHLELKVAVNPTRAECSIFGGSSYTVPYGGGIVSYGVGIKNSSGDTWNERYFMTEEVNGARNNIGDLVSVGSGANTRKFDITHTVTTTTTFNYIVWVSPGVPGGADGHYYAPATPFYPNIPGPTTVVRDHGHYPPYADHLHWNHSNRIQLPGHWSGTLIKAHWEGQGKNKHWVTAHWSGPWVPGPWVGGEDGHQDLYPGPAPGSATCSVTVIVADPPIYSSAGSFLEASCTAIRGNIWYQGTGGAPRGLLRIIRNSDGASVGDVGVGAWDGSGSSTYFNKDPFRSWRLAPHDTYTVQLYGQNSAGDWDPMLKSTPLNGGNPCLRVQSCNITTDTAPEPGQATTATISVTTANSTSVPFDPSYGYSVGFNSTGSSVSPPSGNQPVSIGTGVSNTSPPIVLNIVANSRIDINADLYYGGAPFQPGSGCGASIRPATLPYFKSFQGDIKAGGVFKNIDGSCNIGAAKYGAILGYARPTTANGGRRGASTDFGAYTLGLIHGSPSGPYGFYDSAINGAKYQNLSFANIGNGLAQDLGGGYMAGNATARPSIGTNHCVTNYFNGASKKLKPTYSPQSSVDANNPPADGNGVDGQYFYQPSGSTYVAITSGSPITGKTTIFVNGNVYISQNITYGPWNPMDTANAPYLTIIAKGNITVAPGVTRLDGLYIAQGGSSPGSGIFATCASPSNLAQPANAAEISGNCRQQLVVNGAVIAQQVMLLRSNGTLLLAPGNNAETSTSLNIAEIFNYMPSMILIQPNWQAEGSGAIIPGLLQGIFSLPPVF